MSHDAFAQLRSRLAALLETDEAEAIGALLQGLALRHDELTSQRDELTSQRDELTSQRDELTSQRDELTFTIQRRDVEIARLRQLLWGRRSEKLTPEELSQLTLSYGGTEAEASLPEPLLPVPEQGDTEPEEAERPPKKRRPNHKGRSPIGPGVERIVNEVPVPEGERVCTCCGATMQVFDYVEHVRVEYVPAKVVAHVERREKLGCKKCRGDAVTAERESVPALPLRVGASLLAQLIESKCDDAQPIHRQCDQFSRLGFSMPPSTAYGYWRYATQLLKPVADALLGTVLDDPTWVGIDDTRLDVLDPTHRSGKYRGHLWCFLASTGLVAYRFTKTWKAAEVAPWFHAIGETTHVQVDDYKGYGAEFPGPNGELIPVVPPERRLGCMMHVRRRFHAALKAGDSRAGPAVNWIREIYKVEEEAKDFTPSDRLALRVAKSLPLLDAFENWVDDLSGRLGTTGKLSEAVRYAKQQRPYVRRCFSSGEFRIDNGAVEREIREPAIGRKNFTALPEALQLNPSLHRTHHAAVSKLLTHSAPSESTYTEFVTPSRVSRRRTDNAPSRRGFHPSHRTRPLPGSRTQRPPHWLPHSWDSVSPPSHQVAIVPTQ